MTNRPPSGTRDGGGIWTDDGWKPLPVEASVPLNAIAALLSHALTKRELFAMAAMQGLLSSEKYNAPDSVGRLSIKYADALLAELSK